MANLILSVATVFLLLVINEAIWRGRTHGEFSRKFVHIFVGSFVAFWPLWLSWQQIQFLGLAFVAVVLVSRQLNIFKTIHSVQRPTWGEVYFGLAVSLTALVTPQAAIFAAALLHMSLADGLAAVIGHKYGRRIYHVFGARKSWLGTLTFAVVSLFTLSVYSWQVASLGWWLPLIVLVATLAENLAPRGLDNLLVPLLVAVLLQVAA